MKNKHIKDIGASVRARLLDLARKTGRDFDAVLVRYFQERFLYRLSCSPYERYFILKGALLFLVYEMPFFRPTKDIDFLGSATSNDMGNIKSMVSEIAGLHLLDDRKVIFSEEFKNQKEKQDQWSAFLKRNRLESGEAFLAAMEKIELFLDPACGLDAANKDDLVWNPETWKWESRRHYS